MNIIGIDPGLSGGVAVIPLYDFYRTQTYSLADYTLSQLSGILQEFRGGGGVLYEQEKDTHCEVYLEEPQLPMLNTNNNNNFSVQAHKKLARSLGQLEGICIGAGYPPNLVSPPKWQNALKCRTGGDKNITKNLAMRVFPFLSRTCKSGPNKGLPISTITHATADALLIALYGYLQYQKPERIPLTVKQNIDTIGIPRKSCEPPTAKSVAISIAEHVFGTGTIGIRRKAPSRPQTYPLVIEEQNHGSDQRPALPDGHGPYCVNPRPRRSR
jgi:hypothetical protein